MPYLSADKSRKKAKPRNGKEVSKMNGVQLKREEETERVREEDPKWKMEKNKKKVRINDGSVEVQDLEGAATEAVFWVCIHCTSEGAGE